MNDAQGRRMGRITATAPAEDCDMVFLTVSTGIGGGIVLGGRLITGRLWSRRPRRPVLVGLGGENLRFEDVASGGCAPPRSDRGRPRRRQRGDLRSRPPPATLGGAAHRTVRRPARPRASFAADARRPRLLRHRRRRRPGAGLSRPRPRAHLARPGHELRARAGPAALGANAGLIGVADLAVASSLSRSDVRNWRN